MAILQDLQNALFKVTLVNRMSFIQISKWAKPVRKNHFFKIKTPPSPLAHSITSSVRNDMASICWVCDIKKRISIGIQHSWKTGIFWRAKEIKISLRLFHGFIIYDTYVAVPTCVLIPFYLQIPTVSPLPFRFRAVGKKKEKTSRNIK